MNAFQIGFIIVVSCLCLASMAAVARGWSSRKEGLIWSGVCLAALVAAIWPQTTVRAAQALGIGRGADLVFYCAVVVMMIGFWMVYIRLRYLRREVTLLVRHLAIMEAERKGNGE